MTTINLNTLWGGGGLPGGGEFRAGDCSGNNATGPAPNPVTGEVTFTCAHYGNTYIYSYHLGPEGCEGCNTIEVTVHPEPCLAGEDYSFCRSMNSNGVLIINQISGPTLTVQNNQVTIPFINFLTNCCGGGAYPDPVEWRTNGGAWGAYSPPSVNLATGNCASEINQSYAVDVRRAGGPTPCEDSAVFDICASPIYGTPDNDGGEDCVICDAVNLRSFINYLGNNANNACLLAGTPPPNTRIFFDLEHRAVGAPNWAGFVYNNQQIDNNWGLLDGVNVCAVLSNGCAEFRMTFRFSYDPPCDAGVTTEECLEFAIIFTACVDPGQIVTNNYIACNDEFNVNP